VVIVKNECDVTVLSLFAKVNHGSLPVMTQPSGCQFSISNLSAYLARQIVRRVSYESKTCRDMIVTVYGQSVSCY